MPYQPAQVTLPPQLLDYMARRRALIADIRGMWHMLDDPAEAKRHAQLAEELASMMRDLDAIHYSIVNMLNDTIPN